MSNVSRAHFGVNFAISPDNSVPSKLVSRKKFNWWQWTPQKRSSNRERQRKRERERETGREDTALVELKAFGRKSSVASCLSCQLLSAVYLLQMFRIHRGSRKSNEVARGLRVWMHLKQSLFAFPPLYLGIFVCCPCYSNSIDVIVLANRWMQREWCNVGNWGVALLWKFVND